jgi:hypothetical protein
MISLFIFVCAIFHFKIFLIQFINYDIILNISSDDEYSLELRNVGRVFYIRRHSSVVEHFIGNEEVEGSILSGGTIFVTASSISQQVVFLLICGNVNEVQSVQHRYRD